MTPPLPSSSDNAPVPRRRGKVLWGGAGVGVAVLAGGLFLWNPRPSSPGSTPRDTHEAHGESHADHTHETPQAKSQAPMEVLVQTDRAARAAATGQRVQAHEALAAALKLSPQHAPALLVKACLALEEGQDTEARDALRRLEAAAPGASEAKLLARLYELRRGSGMDWQQAFRQAWVDLGQPDFQQSALLPGATPLPPDPAIAAAAKAAWERAASDDVRLMLALGSPRLDADKALFLLRQVPRLEDPSLFVAVMDVLRGEALPQSSHDEARAVFRQKLEALAAAHPRAMQLQLLLLLGDTEPGSEMSAAEMDRLEQVAALPVWREGVFTRTYEEARKLLEGSGVPDVSATAMAVAAHSVTDRGSWVLRTRNVGTRGALSPEDRKRLGRITRDIGARMAEQPTMVERMVGLQLIRGGAQELGDEAGREQALARIGALEGAVALFHEASMDRWPLHALTEELIQASTRDEPAYLLSFTRVEANQAAETPSP
ncbi:tetratricopeptide repeat protein [Myxococcus sp. AM010]|nr:tetratricopeptide repeat protein [Myxococcus sp. AM010]